MTMHPLFHKTAKPEVRWPLIIKCFVCTVKEDMIKLRVIVQYALLYLYLYLYLYKKQEYLRKQALSHNF